VRIPDGVRVVHQPEAGIVLADRAVAALAAGLDIR
jgi:hypothetical protein